MAILLNLNGIAKVSKRPQQDSNPRPLDCQSHALITEPPRPTICIVRAGCNGLLARTLMANTLQTDKIMRVVPV